jgi:hypothetical protein
VTTIATTICLVFALATVLVVAITASGLGIVIAYLIGLVLTMPVTVALALAERTRWGSVTLGVGALVVCVLFARINQIWNPHGG